jgi:hypothetical protein
MWNKQKPARKRLMAALILVLLVAFSMFGFTLGTYVRQSDLFKNGWIGPKHFAFTLDNTVSHRSLEPGQSVSYPITVSNTADGGVAQVDLQVSISITFPTSLAGTGRISATLSRSGQTIATSDTGTLECAGSTLPAATATTDEYTLTLTWLDADLTYLSDKTTQAFDNAQIHVSVSGYQ